MVKGKSVRVTITKKVERCGISVADRPLEFEDGLED